MTGDMPSNDEVLVVSDQNGNVYVIPRPVVEAHRLDADQISEFQSQIGDDVAGFQMQSAYMMERMAGFRQSERLAEADQARMARFATSEGSENSNPEAGAANPFQGMVTGVWRRLSGMRPATS